MLLIHDCEFEDEDEDEDDTEWGEQEVADSFGEFIDMLYIDPELD